MNYPVTGAGLGLRRALIRPLRDVAAGAIDFIEVAPENWLEVGGKLGRAFDAYASRYPVVFHGLSLSLGAPAPLDEALVRAIASFMRERGIRYYSEHLSYCGDDAHLYDLLPIPFSADAAQYVAARIARVQDIVGERIAVENISYYATLGAEMTELEFINEVLAQADCDLLLDINNIVVNSVNHGYDAVHFLDGVPAERVRYLHIAGHHVEAPDLYIDTHGEAVSDAAWTLLGEAYARFGPVPTLLERDSNIPPVSALLAELARIRDAQHVATTSRAENKRKGTEHG